MDRNLKIVKCPLLLEDHLSFLRLESLQQERLMKMRRKTILLK